MNKAFLLGFLVVILGVAYWGASLLAQSAEKRHLERAQKELKEKNMLNDLSGKKVKSVIRANCCNLLIEFDDGTSLNVKSYKYCLKIN